MGVVDEDAAQIDRGRWAQHESLPIPGLGVGCGRAEGGLPLPRNADEEIAVHHQLHARRIRTRSQRVRPHLHLRTSADIEVPSGQDGHVANELNAVAPDFVAGNRTGAAAVL